MDVALTILLALFGGAVGGFFGPAAGLRRQPAMQVAPSASTARVAAAPAVRVSAPADVPDDDAFLMHLEMALAEPTLRELEPFDALTPTVREVGLR